MSSTQSDRFHAFDALRASMMLLGIVLHAACNYMTVHAVDVWPYQDNRTSSIADLLVLGIHVFRMPIFFVMAGFFTALLVQRRGDGGMLRNRMSRVALPFLLFWLVLAPVTAAAVFMATGAKADDALGPVRTFIATGPYWTDNTMHLWFLWYLTLYYLMVTGARVVAKWIPQSMRDVASRLFVAIMQWRLRAVVFAIPMAVVLVAQGGMLQTALSFKPDALVLAGYVLFFGFGYALWHHRELVLGLTRDARRQILIALALLPLNVGLALKLGPSASSALIMQTAITGALIVWLLVFGITGLAVRIANYERAWVRYLTDASYWMYLVHLPLMLVIPGLLARVELPAVVKLLLTIVIATPLLLASYHWLVRDTLLGVLLNGRRYPRRVAAPRGAGVPVRAA